jgi:methylphosphotriester-DNA--protein-cysteine methyltransferase
MLERLAKVVQHKTIDNEIHKSVEMHAKFKKKLGMTKKRVEMQRLTEENQRMLKRIQEVPPAYNHLEWEEDAKRKEHIKRCMALYPEYYEKLDKETEDKKKRATSLGGSSGHSPVSFPRI